MKKEILDSKEILDDIDNFEDYVERLYLSNEVSYDEKYHKNVIKMYRDLVGKVRDSDLSNEDKGFMLEIISELFNTYKGV